MGYNARWLSKTWARLIDQKIIFSDLISTFFVHTEEGRPDVLALREHAEKGFNEGEKCGPDSFRPAARLANDVQRDVDIVAGSV